MLLWKPLYFYCKGQVAQTHTSNYILGFMQLISEFKVELIIICLSSIWPLRKRESVSQELIIFFYKWVYLCIYSFIAEVESVISSHIQVNVLLCMTSMENKEKKGIKLVHKILNENQSELWKAYKKKKKNWEKRTE